MTIRRGLWVAMALFPQVALAGWTAEELRPLTLAADTEDVVIGTWGGVPVVVGIGPGGLQVVDVDTGAVVGQAELAGRAVLLRDLDGNGDQELLACGPDGVSVVRGRPDALGKPLALIQEDCSALAAWQREGTTALLVGGEAGVSTYHPGSGGLVRTALDGPVGGNWLLATSGPRFAVGSAGGDGLWVWGRNGRSMLATGGAIDALASGPMGWTWIRDGALFDATDVDRPVVAEPADVAELHLGDKTLLAIAYPGRKSVGIRDAVSEGEEKLAYAPRHLGVGEVTGDSCPDLVALSANGAASLVIGDCGAQLSVAALPNPRFEDGEEPPERLAVPVGEFPDRLAEPMGEDAAPEPEPDVVEVRGGQVVDLDAGWSDVEIAVGTEVVLPLTASGDVTRYRTLGLPDGLQLENGVIRGRVEDAGTWRVMVTVYEGDLPRRDASGFTLVAGDGGRGRGSRRGGLRVQDCLLSVGLALGAWNSSAATGDWENLGNGGWSPMGSPAGALTCAGGNPRFHWFAGIDSAITFLNGNSLFHLAAASGGLEAGGENAKVGIYASLGLAIAGVGVRGVVLPFEGKRGGKSGFELRFMWIPFSAPAYQTMVNYAIVLGRRRS